MSPRRLQPAGDIVGATEVPAYSRDPECKTTSPISIGVIVASSLLTWLAARSAPPRA